MFIPASKTAARVKYPAALHRCKFDTPLLAARSLILQERWMRQPDKVLPHTVAFEDCRRGGRLEWAFSGGAGEYEETFEETG